jgi:hypothetical protein
VNTQNNRRNARGTGARHEFIVRVFQSTKEAYRVSLNVHEDKKKDTVATMELSRSRDATSARGNKTISWLIVTREEHLI